jgi:S-adenosylmethionine-diacylgycerolhomoserine-N-methlytransferase
MGMLADARVLLALARGASGGGSHANRLERFYAPQARDYDRFRERLLHGRSDLVESLPVEPGSRVVELGGGTGRNVEYFGERLPELDCVRIVDLCEPLLEVARQRFAGFPNVCCTLADATTWRPAEPVDCVYFSYALTMIPDWRAAIDNAIAMLARGGTLGVVDFHVSARHGRATRAFWPRWFAHDGVHLSDEHLPYLQSRLAPVRLEERWAPVPYLPGPMVPYYLFVGRPRT